MAAEDEAESAEDHIHHFSDLDSKIYLTEEEHDMFAQVDGKNLTEELEQYHKGYMHAIDDIRKIKLRNRDEAIQKKGGNSTGDAAIPKGGLKLDQPSSSYTSPEKENDKQKGTMVPINMIMESSNVKRVEPVVAVEHIKALPMFDL